MSETRTVTLDPTELAAVLATIKGAEPIGLTVLTEPTLRAAKTCPYGVIRKMQKLNAFCGAGYEAAVNRQRARQGMPPTDTPFQAKEHAWAEPVPGSPALRRHKVTKAPYLAVHVMSAGRATYLYQRSGGYWTPIAKEKLLQWLPKDQTESAAARQGVDAPVVFRTLKMDSVLTMRRRLVTHRVRRPGGVVLPVIRPPRYVSPLAAPISEALTVAPEALAKGLTKRDLPSLGATSGGPLV